MKILGILLVILGIFKLSMTNKVNKEDLSERVPDLPINADTLYQIVSGCLVCDGLLEVICGLFIVLL